MLESGTTTGMRHGRFPISGCEEVKKSRNKRLLEVGRKIKAIYTHVKALSVNFPTMAIMILETAFKFNSKENISLSL